MWQQYSKTFREMQMAICLVTFAVIVLTRRENIAAAFFVMMQGGAIFGAMWGVRLKRLFEGSRAGRLPSRRA
jgi:hypothetical protein